MLRALDRGLARPARETGLYTRSYACTRDQLLQVLRLAQDRTALRVQPSRDALDVDFRYECTRDDVPGIRRTRPGFLLAAELDRTRGCTVDAVLLNGNNVGYWGNHLVVERGLPVYKRRGPTFDDGRLSEHLSGPHPYFTWSEGRGYTVADYCLDVVALTEGEVSARRPENPNWPTTALTGFPVLRAGRPVWLEERHRAWDPRLLYGFGPRSGVTQAHIRQELDARAAGGEPPRRHALTVVGAGAGGDAVVVVAERSRRSRGLSVAEAADVMLALGVQDALVLGAAGDAQLATTDEGFLTAPLVERHARPDAQPLGARHLSPYVRSGSARPVPCLLTLGAAVGERTMDNDSGAAVEPPRRAASTAGRYREWTGLPSVALATAVRSARRDRSTTPV